MVGSYWVFVLVGGSRYLWTTISYVRICSNIIFIQEKKRKRNVCGPISVGRMGVGFFPCPYVCKPISLVLNGSQLDELRLVMSIEYFVLFLSLLGSFLTKCGLRTSFLSQLASLTKIAKFWEWFFLCYFLLDAAPKAQKNILHITLLSWWWEFK